MTRNTLSPLPLALLGFALAGLTGGGVLWLSGQPGQAGLVWTAGVLPVLLALGVEILRSLRRGEVGLDIVAALSMTAALIFGETLAAAVVALMYSGGTFLESFAQSRAQRAMTQLLSRVPRRATRRQGTLLEEIALAEVRPDDLLLIRQGDVAPVDGTLAAGVAVLDQSALTGESLPVRLARGQAVMSGATNLGEAFEMVATRTAEDSTYAGIVRLVEQAQASKAPMVRLADRWSLVFLAVTLALAGGAWALTGDPIRAVAVLVVATPCPLILAVPVALVGGLSRAARFGVLIKGAQPLEAMAGAKRLILDKTGTLTDGRPQILSVAAQDGFGPEEVLALAAALDQASRHPVAQALVAAATAGGLALPIPEAVAEVPGEGVRGSVAGRPVVVGGLGFVAVQTGSAVAAPAAAPPGAALVAVAVAGRLAGVIVLADGLRAGVPDLLAALRARGIGRITLATGDRRTVAETVAQGVGLDAICADLSPQDKARLVQEERSGGPVIMVGDGVNDAPALAAADVGVAMGARGAAASAEAADVVLLVDRLDGLLSGIEIAQGARRIALQSVMAGIGLSVLGMIAAAFGYLTPVQGAVLQEGIDVAVILNALRALRISPSRAPEPKRG
ncbi:heavy metal translocating P-type ATPase [Pseudotabrizicola algicola]|uniref:P-type Zn(2+) transporter n=1 Tax=Pseudotabrizicola algicola TaxID=2709381 RepID=A0A6B3RP94_9RHOB|nr:heavy metal translocating P-type ATPase [Pseudotabrizicola algicola]NEX47301.1 heavy metal translocating P-type ATPase [Pseudotabrizicola algicola]